MSSHERRLASVPSWIRNLLLFSLIAQLIWYQYTPSPHALIRELTPPPSLEVVKSFSLGDSISAAKILMLWLQAFDNQSGQFLSNEQLNYDALELWLERISQLDPRAQYPILAASYQYAHVRDDPKRQRQMLEFVYKQFFIDPEHRWMWLAHVAVLAKHRLKDLQLALKYAQAITDHATPNMPRWAQEMQIFILEDMGELERAQLVIGGMLAKGNLTDVNEITFLAQKLEELEQKSQTIKQDLPK
ncbi:MAG: hypothetical protein R3E08_15325 [Thiotrichaceae bacterium]